MRMIARAVAPRLAGQGIAVHTMSFRYQGWNGDERAPVADVRWAVERCVQRYGDAPIVLAPWLPPDEPTAQLAGRRLLLAHGTQDRVTSPRSSFEYAVRARAEGYDVARIVLPGSGHTLLARARDWNRLVLAFSHSCLAEADSAAPPRYADVIAGAFHAAAPDGLRRVLISDGRVRV
ncbi:MAG: hypothetical protein AUG49_10490 [Catenulispora sp. 13_1_20CM_3_70_7]|nr:MAG: hypothetical protein AUG49_10490 [Catenulispora sp. 13_1_20CM_3_70_7]